MKRGDAACSLVNRVPIKREFTKRGRPKTKPELVCESNVPFDEVATFPQDTEGFFFGESDGSEQEYDLLFVERARLAIERGLSVLYDSWW